MRTKDPDESKDHNELKDIAFYWLKKCYMLQVEKKALLALLDQHKIFPSTKDYIEKMDQVQNEISQEIIPSNKNLSISSKKFDNSYD